ncbi:MAG TPA: dockerin type I repeat-containing protein, partial [Pirellulales bacterium]
MRGGWHHQRPLRLSFEQLELRAMLSVSTMAPLAPIHHSRHANVPAVVNSAKPAAAKVLHAAVAASAAVPTPQAGDLNFDGKINAADIGPLLQALADPAGYEQTFHVGDAERAIAADVNQDGTVNNADLISLFHLILSQPPPPPRPPPPIVPPIIPTGLDSNTAPLVLPVNTTVIAGPSAVSSVIVSAAAGASIPAQSTEALLAGGGGDAQSATPTVANIGPPLPTHARTTDIALAAFASDAGGGGDQA